MNSLPLPIQNIIYKYKTNLIITNINKQLKKQYYRHQSRLLGVYSHHHLDYEYIECRQINFGGKGHGIYCRHCGTLYPPGISYFCKCGGSQQLCFGPTFPFNKKLLKSDKITLFVCLITIVPLVFACDAFVHKIIPAPKYNLINTMISLVLGTYCLNIVYCAGFYFPSNKIVATLWSFWFRGKLT